MKSSIAIIGPGAIGGTLAAQLLRAHQHEITLCARTPFHELRIDRRDEPPLITAPPILLDPSVASPVDWVFVTTKAYDVAGTVRWFASLVGPSTHVAIIQNGVEHIERFRTHVDPAQLLPVMINLPVERTAPGRIRQRGPAVVRVPDSERGRAFVSLFASTEIDAATTSDFLTVAWRKLALNSIGALNAILNQPAGLAHDAAIAALMRDMVLEVIAVARAQGAKLADSLADEIVAGQRAAPPDAVNSLHADRLAGRRMETDARNGAVVRAGRRHGIPTPLNSMALALLDAVQPPA